MGWPGASALLEAHFTPVQSSSLCTGYKIQKRLWLLKRRGTSSSRQKIPSFKGYLAIQLWLMGLEDTFKWEPALLWYCSVLRKVSLPCQDKPSEHSTEQVAGWLNSFADHPTASGKTRQMSLQSPVRVACGKFAHGCSPACLIFYSVCITASLSGCPGSAAVWPKAMTVQWQRGEEGPSDSSLLTQRQCSRVTGAKADPWGSWKSEVMAVKPAVNYMKGSSCHSWGQRLLCWHKPAAAGHCLEYSTCRKVSQNQQQQTLKTN